MATTTKVGTASALLAALKLAEAGDTIKINDTAPSFGWEAISGSDAILMVMTPIGRR